MKVIHAHGTPLSNLGWKMDRIHEYLRWQSVWTGRPLETLDRIITKPFQRTIPNVSESELLKIEQEVIHIEFPDSYLNLRWKNLGIFNYFTYETDFEFIFNTTTSSMLKPYALYEVVSSFCSSDLVYAGARAYSGANFAAGNNRLLSRSSAQLLLEHYHRLDPAIIEDKAIGIFFEEFGVPFVELPSLNVSSFSELGSTNFNEYLKSNFHIRVKSGTFKNRNDVELMKAVYKKLNEAGGII